MNNPFTSIELIENRIYIIRGQRVMLDQDLASLYGVPTKRLNEQVRRNIDRFPEDFMFQLAESEAESSRSQFATLNTDPRDNRREINSSRSQIVTLKRGHNIKYLPYAFTEQGVAMLSSVLRSPQAVKVNIEIMRAFVRIRHVLESSKELSKVVFELRSFMLKNSNKTDQEIKRIWNAIEKLSGPPTKTRPMGFNLS